VEETLRRDSPVQMFKRKATRDMQIRSQKVSKGDMAMGFCASGNRDPHH
jgi:cytochrome P450